MSVCCSVKNARTFKIKKITSLTSVLLKLCEFGGGGKGSFFYEVPLVLLIILKDTVNLDEK